MMILDRKRKGGNRDEGRARENERDKWTGGEESFQTDRNRKQDEDEKKKREGEISIEQNS